MKNTLKALLMRHAFDQITFKSETIVPIASNYNKGWNDAIRELCNLSDAFEEYVDLLTEQEQNELEELLESDVIEVILREESVSLWIDVSDVFAIAAGDAESVCPDDFKYILPLVRQYGEDGLNAWVSHKREADVVELSNTEMFKLALEEARKPKISQNLNFLLDLEKVSAPKRLKLFVSRLSDECKNALEYLLDNEILEMHTDNSLAGAMIKADHLRDSSAACQTLISISSDHYLTIQNLHVAYGDDGVKAWVCKHTNKPPKASSITSLFVQAINSL